MSTEEIFTCRSHLKSINKEFYVNGLGCNGTFDTLLCWEATAANTTLTQKCPEFEGIFDSSKTVYKYCTEFGFWENPDMHDVNDSLLIGGKTDYIKYCLSDSAKAFEEYLHDKETSTTILRINRYFEFGGLCLSLISICLSLFIFLYFKSLIRNQTKIHMNLLAAILIQVTLRLIIYVDQLVVKSEAQEFGVVSAISKHTQGLCQTLYIFLQFSLSSMFMWMLIEGFYLNLLLMNALFDENKHRIMLWFYMLGWVLPVLLVLPWMVVMIVKVGINKTCWLGYDKMNYYWILQGPRFIFMAINVFCLINVIRVLITKLRDDRTENTKIVKKGLKAAILLLPLLGIAHIVNFFDPPKQTVLYTIYSISTSFLLMYQGFFVSVLYCFLNNEVKKVLKRFWMNRIGIKSKLKSNKKKIQNNKKIVIELNKNLEKQKFIIEEKDNDDKSKKLIERI